jgi:hypothetical protein
MFTVEANRSAEAFILSWMKERTKKITAVKRAAESRCDSTKMYQTHSQSSLRQDTF